MNCRQAEQWLLLKDTGELSFRKRLRLEEHLTGCAHCRAYRDDLGRVISMARQNLPAGEPGAGALAAIREAARVGIPARKACPSPAREAGWRWSMAVWPSALAAAAIFMLCLGGWYWLAGRGPSPAGPGVAREQPALALASLSGEEVNDWTAMLAEDVIVIEPMSDLSRRSDISPLDRDLLLLEGLAI